MAAKKKEEIEEIKELVAESEEATAAAGEEVAAEATTDEETVEEKTKPTKKTTTKSSKSKKKAESDEVGESNDDNEMPEDVLPQDVTSDEESHDDDEDEPDLVSTIAEAVALAMQNKNNTFASKSESKKLYGKGIKVSRGRNVNLNNVAKTREERIKDELKLLSSMQLNGRKFVKVHIQGMNESPEYGYVMEARLAGMDIGEFTIQIPANELFSVEDRHYMEQPSRVGRQGQEAGLLFKNDLERFVGSNVNVIITSVNEKERTAWASRLRANAILSDICFRKKRENGQPLVKEGMVREGEIIFPKVDRVWVCVDGIDMEIKTAEAGWTSMGPLDEENKFQRGNKVNVKLLSIEPNVTRDVNGKKLHLAFGTGSIRLAEEDPQKSYLHDFKVGQLYEGVVKNVSRNGEVWVVLCGKVSALCEPGIDLPIPGQTRLVKILGLWDNTGNIKGKIINKPIKNS